METQELARTDESDECDLPESLESDPDDLVDVLSLKLSDDVIVNARVQARVGQPMYFKTPNFDVLNLKISRSTGVVQLPFEHSWQNVQSKQDAHKASGLVRAFTLTLAMQEPRGCTVLFMRRDSDNQYQELNYGADRNGVRIYPIRDIPVLLASRSDEQQAFQNAPHRVVFTANKRQGDGNQATNRVDIAVLKRSGVLELWQLTLQTFDDGETFRLIPEMRLQGWFGKVRPATGYQPTASHKVYLKPDIADLMRNLIFVPDAGFPGFDQKAELLLVPNFFRALQEYLPGFLVYQGTERNHDLKIVEQLQFRNPRQGVVKFWDKTGAGGFGIVERMESDGSIKAFAFNYRSFTEDNEFTSYGDPVVVRGDIVTWESEIEIPSKDGDNKPRPPLVHGLNIVHQTTL